MTSMFPVYLRSCGKKTPVVNRSPFNYICKRLFLLFVKAWHHHPGRVKERYPYVLFLLRSNCMSLGIEIWPILYVNHILEICFSLLIFFLWLFVHVQSALAISKLCEILGESLSSCHPVLLKSLMKEIPGRLWEVGISHSLASIREIYNWK